MVKHPNGVGDYGQEQDNGINGGGTLSISSSNGTSAEDRAALLGERSSMNDPESLQCRPSDFSIPAPFKRHNTGYDEVDIEGPFNRVVESHDRDAVNNHTGTPRFFARARAALLGTQRRHSDRRHSCK